MSTLSAGQIYALAASAGFSASEAAIATAIALAESGGRTDAVGDTGITTATWGPSIGLWQIRSLKADTGTGRPRDGSRLTDPAFNAKAARSVFQSQGWNAWSVYKNERYKTHLPAANAAAQSANLNGGLAASGNASADAGSVSSATDPANSGGGWMDAIGAIPSIIAKVAQDYLTLILAVVLLALGIFIVFRKQIVPLATTVATKGLVNGKALVE